MYYKYHLKINYFSNNGVVNKMNLKSNGLDYSYFSLKNISSEADIEKLPYSIRVLLENMIRSNGKGIASDDDIENVRSWNPSNISKKEIIYLNYKNYPNLSLITAIQMTTCFPLFFKPIIFNDELYVDGGVVGIR